MGLIRITSSKIKHEVIIFISEADDEGEDTADDDNAALKQSFSFIFLLGPSEGDLKLSFFVVLLPSGLICFSFTVVM